MHMHTCIHKPNTHHKQADTPETNMPARCFLEGLGYGSPVSHVRLSRFHIYLHNLCTSRLSDRPTD